MREAGRILREENLPHLDYSGFVEGDDIGRGKVDVVVTEGFAGNIALKSAEGTARQMAEYLQSRHEPIAQIARIGYLFAALGISGRCGNASTRAVPMAAFFSGLTALSSRATAAPTPRASPRRSKWATAWSASELLAKITTAIGLHHGDQQRAVGGAAS